jgi:hypothetical protein
MATEFHALGLAYKSGKKRGFVLTRFVVSGQRVISEELLSPEPEPINFAAARLKTACLSLIQAAKEDVEPSDAAPRQASKNA